MEARPDTIHGPRCAISMIHFHDPSTGPISYSCAANDGGVKRGDRADTGDEEARPTAGSEPEDETESLGHQVRGAEISLGSGVPRRCRGLMGVFRLALNSHNLLEGLVAGDGFEPPTFGL